MNIQQCLDNHRLEIEVSDSLATQEVVIRNIDIFEAWDLYSMLKVIEPMADLKTRIRSRDGRGYELGLIYTQHLKRALDSYQKAAVRRKHSGSVACTLISVVTRRSLMPIIDAWDGGRPQELTRRERMCFVRDYEQIVLRTERLMELLQDILRVNNDTDNLIEDF